MYTVAFFRTKLGHASLASIAAMTAMVALTGQVALASHDASVAEPSGQSAVLVELA